MKRSKFIFCWLCIYALTGCKNLHYVTYDCPKDFRNENIQHIDTITIEHPVIITVHEGGKAHDLLLPYSTLKSINAKSGFNSVLKNGGMLIAYHSVESYNYKLKSSIKDSDLIVKNITKIGKNEIKEFEHPVKKFLMLKISKGCYNKLERFIGWIPLTGRNEDIDVFFPIR